MTSKPRTLGSVAAAVLAALPATAAAGISVRAVVEAPAGDVGAGATVQVSCWAEGTPGSGMLGGKTAVDRIDVTVTGGTLSPAALTGAASQTCSSGAGTCSVLQGSVSWTTPATPGTFTATCTASYTTTPTFGAPTQGTYAASATLSTTAASVLPPVVASMTGPGQVVAGQVATFEVTASDPNAPPLPLAYAWSATGGSIAPDPSNPASAAWTAPQAGGRHDVSVSVSNGVASSVSTRSVVAVLAAYQASVPVPVAVPRRIASDAGSGAVFVVDGRQDGGGRVGLLTPRGEVRGFASIPEPALAVAVGAGTLWVTTAKGSVFRVDASSGRVLGKVPLAEGSLLKPLGIAWDASRMALWIADLRARGVRVVRPDGTSAAVLGAAGAGSLRAPIDVAVDSPGGRAWVLLAEPNEAGYFLHAFDLDGKFLGSHVRQGGAAGELGRAGGIAVGADGRVYVSDALMGVVQVYGRTGTFLGSIGSMGEGQGQLLTPTGLATLANGDLAVANTTRGRVDRFGSGAPLTLCPGDSDCDGLPDAWEIAHGLDPRWAGDALLDHDGDGLVNAEEFAYGTDPRRRDTDGDGFSDGDELLAGFDPLDPGDHRATLSVTAPSRAQPGLVRMSAVAGPGTCTVTWTRKSGAPLSFETRERGTSAELVAREAGVYAFEAVASCERVLPATAQVQVAVDNLPPRPDAGRVVVLHPSDAILLDAVGSSDPNGDTLSFSWDQTLGPAVAGAQAGSVLAARPRGAGLYAFQLTATDPVRASAAAEVPVLVAGGAAPTAIAGASPSVAEVGTTVALDASPSFAGSGATWSWRQVAGPAADVVGANGPIARFVPSSAGRYGFEVSVGEGRLRSPPARVDVYVAEPGGTLPEVEAHAAASVTAVDVPVELSATASGAVSSWAWRQVSGPAAGLADADGPTATAVPFAPGFYVFEVSARDGAAEGRPARVAFEARSGGKAIPVARAAAAPGSASVGQLVVLDGRASTGAARWRWTQVAGPWVAVAGQAPMTTFHAVAPGTYAFELEVDDGATRSAPARVEIEVAEEVK